MLAVHWTPVKNTKAVLKNGITKSCNGLYCFPLTGHKSIDQWWVKFFNRYGYRDRLQYQGIVFRLEQSDMPAYFGHWIGATVRESFEKEITDVKMLGKQFRETIMFRLGERIAWQRGLAQSIPSADTDAVYMSLAEQEILQSPSRWAQTLGDEGLMAYTFEDYQIVLSNSIPADRIIKILPHGSDFGRVRRLKKKYDLKNARYAE